MNATIDYLTLTSPKDELGIEWYKSFLKVKNEHPEARGREAKERTLLGYSGLAIDGMMWWGHSPKNGYIFQATSSFADDLFGEFYSPLSRVTRIDLAVTAKPVAPVPKLAEKHYNKAVVNGTKAGNTRIMTSSSGGSTLYVGSAKSDTFGRLYDKGAQTGNEEIGVLWRYEVVIRKPKASPLAQVIADTMRDRSWCMASRDMIATFVYNWYLNRGVQPFWKPETTVDAKLQLEYSETSADRKLRWIRDQVSPSMAWLIDNGFKDELEEAIGFQLSLPVNDLPGIE